MGIDDNDRKQNGTFTADPLDGGEVVSTTVPGTPPELAEIEPLPAWDVARVLRDGIPEPTFVVRGWFTLGTLVALLASRKTGKSTLMYWMAINAALGRGDSTGAFAFTEPHLVLYVEEENGDQDAATRWGRLGIHEALASGRLRISQHENVQFVDDAGVLRIRRTLWEMRQDPAHKDLPVIVFIDSSQRTFRERNENSSEDRADRMNKLKDLIQAEGCTVVLAVNTGIDGDRWRGHSSGEDQVDTALFLKGKDDEPRTLTLYLKRGDYEYPRPLNVIRDTSTDTSPIELLFDHAEPSSRGRQDEARKNRLAVLEAMTEPGATGTGKDLAQRTGLAKSTYENARRWLDTRGYMYREGREWRVSPTGRELRERLRRELSEVP